MGLNDHHRRVTECQYLPHVLLVGPRRAPKAGIAAYHFPSQRSHMRPMAVPTCFL